MNAISFGYSRLTHIDLLTGRANPLSFDGDKCEFATWLTNDEIVYATRQRRDEAIVEIWRQKTSEPVKSRTLVYRDQPEKLAKHQLYWSPKGRFVIVVSHDQEPWLVVDAVEGKTVVHPELKGKPIGVSWHREEDVAFCLTAHQGRQRAWLVSVSGSDVRELDVPPEIAHLQKEPLSNGNCVGAGIIGCDRYEIESEWTSDGRNVLFSQLALLYNPRTGALVRADNAASKKLLINSKFEQFAVQLPVPGWLLMVVTGSDDLCRYYAVDLDFQSAIPLDEINFRPGGPFRRDWFGSFLSRDGELTASWDFEADCLKIKPLKVVLGPR